MRITVLCNDTRGGVQAYVPLARGLIAAGHEVRGVAPSDLAHLFSDAGIPVTKLTGSVEEAARQTGAAEKGVLATMRYAAKELPRIIADWTQQTLAACEGADILTGGIGGMVIGLSVAEKLGKPFVETQLQPIDAPTSAYPGVLLPRAPRMFGLGYTLSHVLSNKALWLSFAGPMRAARERVLGLRGAPRAHLGSPVLYGFSERVVPLPRSTKRERLATGYWISPPVPWQPPQALADFLSKPGPVVAVGFGSMASQDPRALTRLVLEAAKRARVRVILLGGWGGLSATNAPDVYFADAIPHDWLYPRVSAVVHHGGAGTTGAGLRAGVPSIVVPFTMDQPFWGTRVHALGVGPAPIARKALTVDSLAFALERATRDDAMKERAQSLARALAEEDGVRNAVAVFARIAT